MDKARGDKIICFCVSFGTTGDILPLVSIALELKKRGYRIQFLGDSSYEKLTRREGIAPEEWHSANDLPQAFAMRTKAGERWLWGDIPRISDRVLIGEMVAASNRKTAEFMRLLDAKNNSQIVAAVASYSSWQTLDDFGTHCAKILSSPNPVQKSITFSQEPPDQSIFRKIFNAIRPGSKTLDKRWKEQTYHLVSTSPTIFPRPFDWLPNMQVTGYPVRTLAADWQPPESLASFLADGEAPIYLGFGSYPFLFGPRGAALLSQIVEGCAQANVRCVIQSSDITDTAGLPRSIFVLKNDVPFGWLFPRCRATVHHGGYGTLHYGLMAGVPQIIYPRHVDQFLWAKVAGNVGIGPGFTGRANALTADRLQTDLRRTLRPETQRKAEQIAALVKAEDGLSQQLSYIEAIIEHAQHGRAPQEFKHQP